MKPFNLEEYLKDPSRKLVTRNGRNIRIVCTDVHDYYPIIALLSDKDGSESIFQYTKYGTIFNDKSDVFDLFFASEKHEGWVNVYKSGFGWSLGASIWQTEEEAKKWIGADDYATTIKIEWEE